MANKTALGHTKGPWKLDRRSENLVGPDGTHVRVYGSGLSFCGLPDDEARANSLLIAAAPELLEALKEAYAVMTYMGDILNGMDCVQAEDIQKTARAFTIVPLAIAKAEATDAH